MTAASFILADSNGFKLIGFVLLLIIWGIGSLVSAANKAKEQAKRRQMLLRTQGQMPPSPPRPPVQAPQRRVASAAAQMRVAPGAALPPLAHIARPVPTPAKHPVHARPAAVRPPQPAPPAARIAAPLQPEPASVRPSAAAPSPSRATAPAIARWLKPQTLRSQYILTEILQPPLGLRPRQEV